MQALVFYKSVKAGFLLGVEQGSGFVIARQACTCTGLAPVHSMQSMFCLSAGAPSHHILPLDRTVSLPNGEVGSTNTPRLSPPSPGFPRCTRRLGDALSNRWSAPAFIKVTGVELGLVGGIDRVGDLGPGEACSGRERRRRQRCACLGPQASPAVVEPQRREGALRRAALVALVCFPASQGCRQA